MLSAPQRPGGERAPASPTTRILLAPMEGLLDHSLRDAITRAGGIDLCVSEFIRITDQLLPERVFTRIVPELLNASRTPSGTPVRAQLLGSDPGCMAENAARLAALGPAGIDLNFGCPAPTVNRHRGGAVLLDEPELVHAIVAAVRRAVPAGMPVSAKMRLGNLEESRLLENAQAIEAGGAGELVVHARTRSQGYRPPAFWDRIARVRLTVVANGEIWSVEDALRCRAESGCTDLMLGRGVVADPGLARRLGGGAALGWSELLPLVEGYWQHIGRREASPVAPRHRAGRLKQWLNLLRRRHPEAEAAFQAVRTVNEPAAVAERLFGAPGGVTAPAARALAAATA